VDRDGRAHRVGFQNSAVALISSFKLRVRTR
jgi:hypothetical protein